MPLQLRTSSMVGKRNVGTSVTVLSVCMSVIAVLWCHDCGNRRLTREQQDSVDALVNSVRFHQLDLSPIRVALFDANLEPGDSIEDLERVLNVDVRFSWKVVRAEEIRRGALLTFDVVVFPGGNAREQAFDLGERGIGRVREFVNSGGGYIGICAGAFLATAKYDCGMAIVNAKPLVGKLESPGKEPVSLAARGAGIAVIELTQYAPQILGVCPKLADARYSGGPIILPAGLPDLPAYVPLAIYRSELLTCERQRGTMVNTAAIIATRFGEGRVILFSPHPEMTERLKPMLTHAVLAVARSHAVENGTGK